MFWETVAALLLIFASFPLWVVAALVWGLINAAIPFFGGIMVLASEPAADWSQFLAVPVVAFSQGLSSAWSVPVEIWTWAKFEHPWWAAIIGLVLMSAGGQSSRSH